MQLHVLIAQRKERYAGEYAPEALAVIDDVGNDENPDYMAEKLVEAKGSDEFENAVVIRIDVDSAQVMNLLRPSTAPLQGKVVAA